MPSIDEVLLLRLLNQCQLRRHELPKLKAYTKELRRTLRALEDGSTEHSVPVSSSQNLEGYKAKISTLEMALAQEEKEQAAAKAAEEPQKEPSPTKASRAEQRSPKRPVSRTQVASRTQQQAEHASEREELLGAARVDAKPRAAQGDDTGLNEDTQAIVSEQRKVQEELSEDMLRMTSEIKQRSLIMEAALQEDNKVMDSIDSQLGTNRGRITAMTQNLKEEVDAMWKGTLGYCGVFLFVTIAFVFMFMFMKIFPKQI